MSKRGGDMIEFLQAVVSGRWRPWAITFRAYLACYAIAILVASYASTPAHANPPGTSPGKARLLLTRVNSLVGFRTPARVKVNGNQVARLRSGGSIVVNIPSGRTAVTVDAPLDLGEYTINLDAKSGKTYALEISPRGERLAAAVVAPGVGALIDAAANKNGGAFQVRILPH